MFRVGRRYFAIEAGHVRGILPAEELAPLSGIGKAILGLTSLGGRPVAVWDLRAKLDLPRTAAGTARHIVVVSVRDRLAAFMADRVCRVQPFHAREIRRGWLHGSGRPHRLLQAEGLFDEKELNELSTDSPREPQELPVNPPPATETAPAALPR